MSISKKKRQRLRSLLSIVIKWFIRKSEYNQVYIGVSKLCTDVGQYSKKFKEAKKSIEVAKTKNRLINEI